MTKPLLIMYPVLLVSMLFSFSLDSPAISQGVESGNQVLFESLRFRSIGPFRGGRSAATTGVAGDPLLYYMGAAGGGVWKTENAGSSWENISDGFFGGSIGAVAVAPSDPNIIYVGGGEVTIRGNVSHGNGLWKSYDAGATWEQTGLEDSHCIPRIRVHPENPDMVFVAALGHLYGPNQQRGVFKSSDGGKTWRRVLFVSEDAGAFDLIVDPNNARVLYATTWKVFRTPYSLESGGEGSGIWKSTDQGETWTEITRNPGLPKGTIGICGITVSPVDSSRVWAIVEAAEGGLFRSDDSGQTWTRVNEERKLRQRAWYYSRVYAGPKNIDEVYVLNVRFWRSGDGGKTFSSISTPHGDHHDLWIAPGDPQRMAIADDGGVQISNNRGRTWSTYENQPTAQFYRVTTDNHFPYRIYGAQQDNSTVRILHRTSSGSIGERDWEPTAGGESGHLAPDPKDADIVYGGSYGGYLTRYNHRTKEMRNIHVWPDNPMGHGAGDGKYRFQWNFPIFFSRHDPQVLYTAANVLFKSTDGGGSWTQVSEDLTRNTPSKQGPSGGPITKDNTGVEYYCTIFAADESRHEPGVIWAGSDDGLLHLTRDGGETWKNVTPPELPEWSQINSIEPHPTEPGGLYVAATRYKLDDFRPYLFKTLDYGKTWTAINHGIDRKHFARVVRADPDRPGLLYAGTESGLYISFNDGQAWEPFQCNVPIVPITDLAIKNKDLVVATQGRSFWVLDDLSIVHQWNSGVAKKPLHLFGSGPTFRMRGGGSARPGSTRGQNVRAGVPFYVYVKEPLSDHSVTRLEVSDQEGQIIVTFSTKPDREAEQRSLALKPGMNLVTWDMRYSGAKSFEGMVLWGGGLGGPLAVPGSYQCRLIHLAGGDAADENREDSSNDGQANEVEDATVQQQVTFEIQKDPRAGASQEDLQAQFDFLIMVRDKLSKVHQSISRIRDVRNQVKSLKSRLEDGDYPDHAALIESAKQLISELTEVERGLYQTSNQSPQDPLNFPIRLNNRLSSLVGVVSTGDNRPTRQAEHVRDQLIAEIDTLLEKQIEIVDREIQKFNKAARSAEIPAIFTDVLK